MDKQCNSDMEISAVCVILESAIDFLPYGMSHINSGVILQLTRQQNDDDAINVESLLKS